MTEATTIMDIDISIEFAADVLRDTISGTGRPDEVEAADNFLRNVEKCLRRDARFQNIKTSELELMLADARRDAEADIAEQFDKWRHYVVNAFTCEAQERLLNKQEGLSGDWRRDGAVP